MSDFLSVGYIGCPTAAYDYMLRVMPAWLATRFGSYWSWGMTLCVLGGFYLVYSGMRLKVQVLGGGINKWSDEARKWKWLILWGFLLIHTNYIIQGAASMWLAEIGFYKTQLGR